MIIDWFHICQHHTWFIYLPAKPSLFGICYMVPSGLDDPSHVCVLNNHQKTIHTWPFVDHLNSLSSDLSLSPPDPKRLRYSPTYFRYVTISTNPALVSKLINVGF
ncbi:hypothetical protein JTE90_010358 [Oedothorax gibbosus]|uniref:Uncharacterized protein n=1 Tax=Oedothorax gibbosus TaxID=931172 RepID=A0AAV6U0K9_9ARAC|nr:hypothetical protein JTE90_010358 [Oedothorax gibbosus]